MKITLKQACIESQRGVFKCRMIPYNMSNGRVHWAVKKKWNDAWYAEVLAAVMGSKEKRIFNKARILINLYKHQFFDTDGAYNAIKPVLDGLCNAGVIIDDSPKYIKLNVEQIKVEHRKDERVEIIITDKYD